MRYVSALASALALATACASPADDDTAGSSAASTVAAASDATITFAANWTSTTSSPLVAGQRARIAYDVARLTACRGDLSGGPGWAISGSYRINGGAVGSFEAGGLSPSHGTVAPIIDLAVAGDLEVWFENTSVWGCHAYDSNYGKNYHFAILPRANAPGFIGNARSVVSRATCSGGPCDGDLVPLERGFTFDTWARQRAAITQALFEVWKQGTTDFDNPDLWKQLDVQLHSRVGDAGPFASSYIGFDRRVGNNARYAMELRGLDPLQGSAGGGALANKDQCPAFATSFSADGQYIQADVQFYMTVNGVELRPAAGGAFHGLYQNYRALYAICESR